MSLRSGPLLRDKAEKAEGSNRGKRDRGTLWTLTGFLLTAIFVVSVTHRENRTSVGQLRFIHAGRGQFSTFATGGEWIEKTFRQII